MMSKKIKVEKYQNIKEALKEQMAEQNQLGYQYDDLLNHAIYLFKLKDVLQKDIEENGIRLKSMTGNGYEKIDDNKSVDKLLKVSAQLMKILNDLNLKEPPALDGENLNENLL